MVVSTLKAARKRTGKIRSNLYTGQYGGTNSPSQGQTLVEPLALPGVARHIDKFLWKTTQKRGSGLAIHTSGLNCHWLKVVIALEVMIFLAFCDLSFCGRKTSLSGRVFVVALLCKKDVCLQHLLAVMSSLIYCGCHFSGSFLTSFNKHSTSTIKYASSQTSFSDPPGLNRYIYCWWNKFFMLLCAL